MIHARGFDNGSVLCGRSVSRDELLDALPVGIMAEVEAKPDGFPERYCDEPVCWECWTIAS